MPRAGPIRSIVALLALAGMAFVAAALTGMPADQARQAANARQAALESMTADADLVVFLLRRVDADWSAARRGEAPRLAAVAANHASLAEALARLADGTVVEPALRPHGAAITALARVRMDSLATSPAGRVELHAARLAAEHLAFALAEGAATEREVALHFAQRVEVAAMAMAVGITALVAAAWLGWRTSRTDSRHLREAQAALGLLHEDGPVGLGLLNPDLVFIGANPRLADMLARARPGPRGLLGMHLADIAPVLVPLVVSGLSAPAGAGPARPGEADTSRGPWRSASATIEVAPCQAGAAPAHWFVGVRPIAGNGGRPAALSVVVIDVSASIRAEAERETLIRELNHRVKNTFATVQAVAAQTLRTADRDFDRFGQDFMGRLMALARSHDLVSARGFGAISLADVAAVALDPFRAAGQVVIGGATDVTVRPAQAQALVVALFELGANATRHGALLQPEGRVTLRWDRADDGAGVRLLWTERGGPELAGPPNHRGFGRRLLERALAHDLGEGAVVALRFDSAGLSCDICFRANEVPARVAA